MVLHSIFCLEGSTPEDGCIYHHHGFYGLDGSCPVEERIDQKVSVGLGGVPPWAFRHRTLHKTSLGSSPMTKLPVLHYRTF